jgi:Costars
VHISKEVVELCNIIASMGVLQDDGSVAVTFGDLFEFYTRISNKVKNHQVPMNNIE